MTAEEHRVMLWLLHALEDATNRVRLRERDRDWANARAAALGVLAEAAREFDNAVYLSALSRGG